MAKKSVKFMGEVKHPNAGLLYVVRESCGSNITYTTWDADYGLLRETISFSTRPRKVFLRPDRYHKEDFIYCCRDRSGVINLDEMFKMSSDAYYFIAEHNFEWGMADSAFSGHMMDGDAYVECDAEYVWIANNYC